MTKPCVIEPAGPICADCTPTPSTSAAEPRADGLTPRTDAQEFAALEWRGEVPGANLQRGCAKVVRSDFARQLERELAEQTASHAQTVGIISDAFRERDEALRELAALKQPQWPKCPVECGEIGIVHAHVADLRSQPAPAELRATKDAEIARLKAADAECDEICEVLECARAHQDYHPSHVAAEWKANLTKLRTQLEAGESAFNQLQQENAALVAERDGLLKELGPLRELVGVDPRAASGLHDMQHWTKLMNGWDEAKSLRAQLTAAQDRERGLREALGKCIPFVVECAEYYDSQDLKKREKEARKAADNATAALATSKPDAGGAEEKK